MTRFNPERLLDVWEALLYVACVVVGLLGVAFCWR
jgi:hypothetical protein